MYVLLESFIEVLTISYWLAVGDCPSCEVLLKEKCYCMTMHLYIKCW